MLSGLWDAVRPSAFLGADRAPGPTGGRAAHGTALDQAALAVPEPGLPAGDVHRGAAQAALSARVPPVEHLGIDETRRGKANFRLVPGPDGGEVWEVVTDRWHVGFCDLTGGAGLLGQVEGRTSASVSAWINAQGEEWRRGLQVVAIDMCTVFKAAVRDSLPHATLVVDRFHVAQLANTALTEVLYWSRTRPKV
jgi:Transposase